MNVLNRIIKPPIVSYNNNEQVKEHVPRPYAKRSIISVITVLDATEF